MGPACGALPPVDGGNQLKTRKKGSSGNSGTAIVGAHPMNSARRSAFGNGTADRADVSGFGRINPTLVRSARIRDHPPDLVFKYTRYPNTEERHFPEFPEEPKKGSSRISGTAEHSEDSGGRRGRASRCFEDGRDQAPAAQPFRPWTEGISSREIQACWPSLVPL